MRNEVIAGLCGVLIGSAVTYYICKSSFERKLEDEIVEVRKHYKKKETDLEKKEKAKQDWEDLKRDQKKTREEVSKKQSGPMKYANVNNTDYIPNNVPIRSARPSEDSMRNREIDLISPDEFGVNPEYDVVTYTYYDNDILTDENDDPVDDRYNVTGEDFVDHIGEYDEDACYVVNNKLQMYIEILVDEREYDPNTRPSRVGIET